MQSLAEAGIMLNPFPGINPDLEQPDYWCDFHDPRVAALAIGYSNDPPL